MSSPSSQGDSSPPRVRNLSTLAGLSPEQRINATLGAKPRRRLRRRPPPKSDILEEYGKDVAEKKSLSKAISFTNALSAQWLVSSSSWMTESTGRLVRSASAGISSGLSEARRLSRSLTKPVKDIEQIPDQDGEEGKESEVAEPVEDDSQAEVHERLQPATIHAPFQGHQATPVERKPVDTFQLPHTPEIGPPDEMSAEAECERKKSCVDNLMAHEFPATDGIVNASEIRDELMRCVENEQVERIRQMLSPSNTRFDHIPIDLLSKARETPALCAARNGRAKSCAVLLDHGADPLARDASLKFYEDGIGVWPDERRPDGSGQVSVKNPRAKPGKTVVYYLRMHGVFEQTLAEMWPATRVRVLKSIAHAMHNFHQRSPLVVAATHGYVDLAALLLTHTVALPSLAVAPPPRLAPHALYAEATHVASKAGLQEASWSEQVNVPSDRAEALLAACSSQHWQIALVLLAAGVTRSSIDVAKDKLNRTALHLAASAGQERLVTMLLQAGASPHVWSKLGRQPLHEATAAGHAEVVASLLEGGASLETRVGERESGAKSSMRNSGHANKNAPEIAMDRGHVHILERMAALQAAGHSKSFCRTRMF